MQRTEHTIEQLGQAVHLTGKVMPNGEVRRRIAFDDVTIHVTETKTGGWQEAHFHKGLRETYTVINGQMALASEDHPDDGSNRYVAILSPGDSITTSIDEAHNVYLYPGTSIVTIVYGKAVDNPDKKGNDWWPASKAFDCWSKNLSEFELAKLAVR